MSDEPDDERTGREPAVTLYASPGCPESERAQWRLEELGIDYLRVEITSLDSPLRTLRGLVGDLIATPILEVGDEARVGLDVDWLSQRLDEDRGGHSA